jgi:hypothetical protein
LCSGIAKTSARPSAMVRAGAAGEERQVQGDEAQEHARWYPDEGTQVVGLFSTEVDVSQVAVWGLVCDPGL